MYIRETTFHSLISSGIICLEHVLEYILRIYTILGSGIAYAIHIL